MGESVSDSLKINKRATARGALQIKSCIRKSEYDIRNEIILGIKREEFSERERERTREIPKNADACRHD